MAVIVKRKLTVKQLQQSIHALWKEKGYKYFSLNTFGMGAFEADFLAIHPENNFCVEFEIKRSRSDFLADFKKKNKHDLLKKGLWPSNQFYFVAEKGILDVNQIPKHLGLIEVEQVPVYKTFKKKHITKTRREYVYDIAIIRKAKVLHQNEFPEHLFVKVLISVMNRFFENFSKTIKINGR